MSQYINKPTPAFIAASWCALILGAVVFCIGLFNANMMLNEKGFYLILLLYGLFSSVSLQKIIRDRLEGMNVTAIYFGLLAIGLWNVELALSEKGFYMMAFLMSLFGAVAVQKNIRDMDYLRTHTDQPELKHSTTSQLDYNSSDDEPL